MLTRLLCLTLLYFLMATPAFALSHYRDVVQDTKGNAMGNVSVSVYEAGTSSLADLYSDDGVTPQDNPFLTDADGEYHFYVTEGVYDIVLTCDHCYLGRDYAFDNAARANTSIGVAGGGGETGWPTIGVPDEITWATNETTSAKIGDGTRKLKVWGDVTSGVMLKPDPLADAVWRCWTNFNCVIRDEEAGASIFTLDPDAASKNAMYQFGTNYKPIASFLLPLEPRGAATSQAESLNTNFEKQWFLTVTDANTDAADFSFPVTTKMAGATTATFRLVGVSKNATPSGNIDFDCSMQTYTPGTDTFAAHSTTGEVTALLTPATQYRPVAVTTASHTINGGALVAGDVIFGSCEVDATATTSAQMTDFRLWGYVLVQLSVNSWSD